MSRTPDDAANIGQSIPDNLCNLIKQSFPHKASGEALVASVYGEWGIGKTWCLKQIEQHFRDYGQTLRSVTRSSDGQKDSETKAIYVPVFFSPWRYEQEQHLIIPLLKTIEHSIDKHLEALAKSGQLDDEQKKRVSGHLQAVGSTIGQFALALTAGLKFDFGLPGASLTVDGEKMLADARHQSSANRSEYKKRDKGESPIETFESLYYESFSSLEQLAGELISGDDTLQVRLVVLIDDLDRCLPEKAVQMLESIKLFLNVQNFAFVLDRDGSGSATRVISASHDHTLRVWDLASGACVQTLSGHEDWVNSVAVLDRDGSGSATRVISASGDKTLRVWDLASGACVQTLSGHEDWVSSVAVLDRDGSGSATRVISAGIDGLCVWKMDDKEIVEATIYPDQRLYSDGLLSISQTDTEVVFALAPDANPRHFICSDEHGGNTSRLFPADPRLYRWLKGVDENGEIFPGFAFSDVWLNLDAEDAPARWEDYDEHGNPRRLVIRLQGD